jgi:hypothetical protein
VGRLVIETDPETGKDHVELTLDNGQVLKFHGNGSSELRFVRGEQEWIEVGDSIRSEKIPGRREPDTWRFSVEVTDIPRVDDTTEAPDGATPL